MKTSIQLMLALLITLVCDSGRAQEALPFRKELVLQTRGLKSNDIFHISKQLEHVKGIYFWEYRSVNKTLVVTYESRKIQDTTIISGLSRYVIKNMAPTTVQPSYDAMTTALEHPVIAFIDKLEIRQNKLVTQTWEILPFIIEHDSPEWVEKTQQYQEHPVTEKIDPLVPKDVILITESFEVNPVISDLHPPEWFVVIQEREEHPVIDVMEKMNIRSCTLVAQQIVAEPVIKLNLTPEWVEMIQQREEHPVLDYIEKIESIQFLPVAASFELMPIIYVPEILVIQIPAEEPTAENPGEEISEPNVSETLMNNNMKTAKEEVYQDEMMEKDPALADELILTSADLEKIVGIQYMGFDADENSSLICIENNEKENQFTNIAELKVEEEKTNVINDIKTEEAQKVPLKRDLLIQTDELSNYDVYRISKQLETVDGVYFWGYHADERTLLISYESQKIQDSSVIMSLIGQVNKNTCLTELTSETFFAFIDRTAKEKK